MFKYTTNTKKKIEQIFKESGYIIRYERGNFNAGYCILEKKKVVVINKFFGLEAQMNSLIEILGKINLGYESLKPESVQMLDQLNNVALELGFSEIKAVQVDPEVAAKALEQAQESEAEASAEIQEETVQEADLLIEADVKIEEEPPAENISA